MEDIKKRFGRRVKELRLSKGLSQEAFAYECGLDRTYIPGIEKGNRNVTLMVIEKISNGLKIELSELLKL